MAKRNDGDLNELTRDLSSRVAAFAPDWTEPVGGDPGFTLVELLGFLAESILARPDLSPQARTRLGEVLAQLDRAGNPGCEDGTLTRNRYFSGKLLSVDDFEQEQSYQRTKHRRHNRLLHGVGIVRGLDVSTGSHGAGGDPEVVVAPGLAIGPDGEELVVCEPVTRDVCKGTSACYVTLALVERPVDPTADGEYSRIEESVDVAVSEDVPLGHLAIARLVLDNSVWRSDSTFRPARVR